MSQEVLKKLRVKFLFRNQTQALGWRTCLDAEIFIFCLLNPIVLHGAHFHLASLLKSLNWSRFQVAD